MNKIVLTFVAFVLSCDFLNAQDFKAATKNLNKTKEELVTQLKQINAVIAKIENRSFKREEPERLFRALLAGYKDVESLADDVNNLEQYKDLKKLYSTYATIISMYNVLQKNGGYDATQNTDHKTCIKSLREEIANLNPAHKESFIRSFDEVAALIEDYEFTMYELFRVFDLVDDLSKEGKGYMEIGSKLSDDGETEYINKINYTKYLLYTYIRADAKERAEIRKLRCFSTIK